MFILAVGLYTSSEISMILTGFHSSFSPCKNVSLPLLVQDSCVCCPRTDKHLCLSIRTDAPEPWVADRITDLGCEVCRKGDCEACKAF